MWMLLMKKVTLWMQMGILLLLNTVSADRRKTIGLIL